MKTYKSLSLTPQLGDLKQSFTVHKKKKKNIAYIYIYLLAA